MSARYGGYYSYSELEDHYRESLSEFHRVLKKKGVVVFKCQDIVHNHMLHCTHSFVIFWAEMEGFRLKDLFVLTAKSRMPGPQKGQQRHARVYHSYFLVLEKR
jgi:ubiquinone/menaquinone biosynthesis C-methylase UbiE